MLKHEWMQQRRQRAHARLAEGDDAPDTAPAEGDEDAQAAAPADDVRERDREVDAEPAPEPEAPEAQAAAPDETVSPAPAPEPPAEAETVEPDEAEETSAYDRDEETEPAADTRAEPSEAPTEHAASETRERGADPRRVTEGMEVPLQSLRDRLESVLARQAQLPLDIEARHAVSEGAEGSPRATREALVQRLLDPTLTLEEVSLLLGVCRTTVRRYTDRGVLRCFRTPGNQRRFHLSDVLDFMERQSRQQ